MSGAARKPNAHLTSSRGDRTISTILPRSNLRMHRVSPQVSEKAVVNQSPMMRISGSALTRSSTRFSHSSEKKDESSRNMVARSVVLNAGDHGSSSQGQYT